MPSIVRVMIVLGIIYLFTVTCIATVNDHANGVNIMALAAASSVLLVHILALFGCFIQNQSDESLGEWPRWMHRLALLAALCFVLFSPFGSGVAQWLRFVVLLLGVSMGWEHTVGLYGREAQENGKGLYASDSQ